MTLLDKVRNSLRNMRDSAKKRTRHAADNRDLPAKGRTGQVTGNSTKPAEDVGDPIG
jgi:hypothetical protein